MQHSYSFDLNMNQTVNSQKIIIMFNNLKWSNIVLLAITIIHILFFLTYHWFSTLIGIFIIFFSINVLQIIHQNQKEVDELNETTIIQLELRKKILLYLIAITIIDIIIVISFCSTFLDGIYSIDDYEIYFSFLKVFMIICRLAFLCLVYFFLKEVLASLGVKNKDETEY
jgi:hypothetical protein